MDTDLVKPILDRLASRLAREWPGIDRDDIAQEMWAKIAEDWHGLKKVKADELPKIVHSRAEKAGTQYCSRERYAYQHHASEWVYTPGEVRTLLADHYFTADSWLDAPKRPERGEQTLLGDGVVVALWDIESAVERLPEADQAILIRAFQMHESGSSDADRKRLQRAIDKATALLNQGIAKKFNFDNHEGPGSRKSVSNAQAMALTGSDY